MRRILEDGAGRVLAGVFTAALLASCGGESAEPAPAKPEPKPAPPVVDSEPEADEPEAEPVADGPRGAAHGVVRYAPSPEQQPVIDMGGDPWCVDQHPDGIRFDRLIVEDGMLANAFVWIDHDFEGYEFEVPSEEVVVDQVDCIYVPRISGAQLGQTVVAKNSDQVLHNVHTKPELNREQNFGMPAGASPRELKFRREEVLVEMVCDVHPWMKAYVGVVSHPFFAVTDASGAWSFDDVPAGTYTVGVWHELAGRTSFELTIAGDDDVDAGDVSLGG